MNTLEKIVDPKQYGAIQSTEHGLEILERIACDLSHHGVPEIGDALSRILADMAKLATDAEATSAEWVEEVEALEKKVAKLEEDARRSSDLRDDRVYELETEVRALRDGPVSDRVIELEEEVRVLRDENARLASVSLGA